MKSDKDFAADSTSSGGMWNDGKARSFYDCYL